MKEVKFKSTRDITTCEDCGQTFKPNDEGRFEVSPHLREKHEFTGEIAFVMTSQVICPRMEFITASCE